MNGLPNFLICGAPKAGTSSLFEWIASHPDAVGSLEKETYFFVDPGTHMHRSERHVANGLASYEQCFPEIDLAQPPRVILEGTPSYIYSETALRHVPDLPARPKCLFIVREPADQIYSCFRYFQGNWDWIPRDMAFEEYVSILVEGRRHSFNGNELARDALRNASYVDFLVRWRERLGDERMMVRTFDELRSDPRRFTKSIAEWVGLDSSFYDGFDFPVENATYAVRSQWLQKINLRVRKALPQGQLYNSIRALYRRANTVRPAAADSADRLAMERLRSDFASSNDRLRREFGLSLPGWA
jgi:hypothetical protein